jgi:hypothetical protein
LIVVGPHFKGCQNVSVRQTTNDRGMREQSDSLRDCEQSQDCTACESLKPSKETFDSGVHLFG